MKNGYFVLVAEIMTAAYTPRPERHLLQSLYCICHRQFNKYFFRFQITAGR